MAGYGNELANDQVPPAAACFQRPPTVAAPHSGPSTVLKADAQFGYNYFDVRDHLYFRFSANRLSERELAKITAEHPLRDRWLIVLLYLPQKRLCAQHCGRILQPCL